MEKYDSIIKALDTKLKEVNNNELISYSEKPYVMFLVIKKMEKNYKSEDDSLMFHEVLCSWMFKHISIL